MAPSGFSRLLQVEQHQMPKRSGQDIPSRTADNLFWLGRYGERLEGGARLLRSLLLRMAGETSDDDPDLQQFLLDLMADQHHLAEATAKRLAGQGADMVKGELAFLIFDADAINGVGSIIANLRHTATAVRERLSSDAWRVLQDLQSDIEAYGTRYLAEPRALLVVDLLLIDGSNPRSTG